MAWWRGLMPAMAGAKSVDLARAGLGAALGLALTGLALRVGGVGWLIAPFGASAVLIFAVPNSPLAQPWSVIVGNASAAATALVLLTVMPVSDWAVPLAVGAAIATTLVLRALHPPAGAVALLIALQGTDRWAGTLATVACGSLVLVGIGALWNRATGRAYPFRQPAQPGTHGTADPTPEARIGVDPAGLALILEEYRQSANLGVADLARLVGAVEQTAAARRMAGITCADIMSRDLITVGPGAHLAEVADHFRARSFASLPVVAPDGALLGVIFQIDLIRRAREDAFHSHQSLIAGMSRMVDDHRASPLVAADIMRSDLPRVTPETPVGALMPVLSDRGIAAVPVVQASKLVGIVTRTDLVAALAQRLALGTSQP